jgi:hypothetical protein
MGKLSFLFLSTNTPWVYALAEALAKHHPTHTARFYDLLNYRRLHPTWPSATPPSLLTRSMHVLPSGYAGQMERLFRPYLQRQIQRWCQQLQKTSLEYPWVVAPYPYLAPWVRNVPAQRLIYYNLDDYVLYQPSRKKRILELEKELIERATITLCLSQSQVETLQKRCPNKAECIHHYPLGVVDYYLNPQPEKPPEPMTVGYIGNLSDRMDWRLIYQVAQACPDITFVFVGGLDGNACGISGQDWQLDREAVLALPNIRHIGQVPQVMVAQYYWSFAVNWIPYAVTHPFNQASCPTKIMDCIASARPILSTNIPECRLYPEWITIFHSAEEAIAHIRRQLAVGEKPEARKKSLKQLQFARQHTWPIRAQTLENWLSQL